jgi:hypothetical protein
MTATTRWILDANWTSVSFTAGDLNSLANGGGALATAAITNSSTLDQLVDISFVVTVGGTTTAGSYVTIYLLPLNQDGSTYGDGYASSTSSQPAVAYGNSVLVKVGVTSGNTITGMAQFVNLPPGDYKIAFGNNLGVALNATAALTLKYRSYNVNLNA